LKDLREDFTAVLAHLRAGDFTLLAPLFDESAGPSQMERWHEERRFEALPAVLLEAFTCACFLGSRGLVGRLLAGGVPPAGGAATGLNAVHWAAARGQHEVLEKLLRHHPDLEALNRYGGTVLGQAVWSAANQPRPGQYACLEALILAGARIAAVPFPSGHEETDAVVRAAIMKASQG
jgi:Ankyrin repeats (3 copies)